MLVRGESMEVYANQAMREAVVLSVVMKDTGRHGVHGQALIEYVMPEGRTFLRILSLSAEGESWGEGYSVSYEAIPVKFLNDMRANFSDVLGILKGGFDAEYVAGKKWPSKSVRARQGLLALATRARILDLVVPGSAAERAADENQLEQSKHRNSEG